MASILVVQGHNAAVPTAAANETWRRLEDWKTGPSVKRGWKMLENSLQPWNFMEFCSWENHPEK